MHLRLLHKNLGYMLWSAMKETTEIFTFEPNLHSKVCNKIKLKMHELFTFKPNIQINN